MSPDKKTEETRPKEGSEAEEKKKAPARKSSAKTGTGKKAAGKKPGPKKKVAGAKKAKAKPKAEKIRVTDKSEKKKPKKREKGAKEDKEAKAADKAKKAEAEAEKRKQAAEELNVLLNNVESYPEKTSGPAEEQAPEEDAGPESQEPEKPEASTGRPEGKKKEVPGGSPEGEDGEAGREEKQEKPVAGLAMGPAGVIPTFRSESVGKGKQEPAKGDLIPKMSAPAPTRRSIRLYRKIALSFISLTAVLLLVIMYFTLIKVEIVIVPNQERLSNSMIFEVKSGEEGALESGVIPGLVEKTEVAYNGTYESTGEEVIGREAVGEATVINNYNRNQPLVATTRLLTPDGKLFRIKNTINVPAGGSVTVPIYADEPGPEMAIEATKFTIPGLWAGLQDKIYAESEEAVEYRKKVQMYVVEEDIETAKRDLKQRLLAAAQEDIANRFSEYSEIKYKIDENSISSDIDAEIGEKTEEFDAEMSAEVVVVAFNGGTAADLARQKFMATLPPNKELIEFDRENIIYALNTYDYLANEATMNSTFEGKVSIKDNAQIVDPEKIKGLSRPELEAYLGQLGDIAGYEIRFSPSFLPGFLERVPRLVDRIEINIEK